MSSTTSVETRKSEDDLYFDLKLSPRAYALIESLAKRTDGAPSEVLSKALALLEVAVDAVEHGYKVGVADQNQPLRREVVGFGASPIAGDARPAGSNQH